MAATVFAIFGPVIAGVGEDRFKRDIINTRDWVVSQFENLGP